MSENNSKLSYITQFSTIHALVMIFFTIFIVFISNPWIIVIPSIISFSTLVFKSRRQWTPKGIFGIANSVTIFRLFVTHFLIVNYYYQPSNTLTIVGFSIIFADKLDGLIARYLNETSEFGDYFDTEADATFILFYGIILYENGVYNWWILVIGLLRYLYLLGQLMFKPIEKKDRKPILSAIAFMFLAFAFSLSFMSDIAIIKLFTKLACTLVIFTFVRDFWWQIK